MKTIEDWATAHNPFFEGPWADVLGLIPFVLLMVLLYLVGRDILMKARPGPEKSG
jgi:hypothetical protein